MFTTQVTSPITQNQYLTFSSTPILKSNDNVQLNTGANGLLITKPGIYKVRLQLNATLTGTDIGAQIYANGNAVSVSSVIVTGTTGDDAEIVIEYPIEVINSNVSGYALVQFMALYGATLLNGYVTVERVS